MRGNIRTKKTKGGISYEARVHRGNGKYKSKSFRYKKDAEAWLNESIRSVQRGEFIDIPDITFKELADKWLDLKKNEIRPRSYTNYISQIQRAIDEFGDKHLKVITQEMVEKFIARLSADVGADLTKRILTVINTVFRKGVQWGYITRNPAEYINKPKTIKREMEFLNRQEVLELIEHTIPRHKCLITFAALTGARQSEILAIKWEDIDFLHGKVYIRRTLHNGKFYEPKTVTSKRSIIIPATLVKALGEHQLKQLVELDKNPHHLVFPNSKGNPMDNRNLTQRILEPALRRAGIRKVSFHALRHSYISFLINQNENIRFISKQVGHSSAKVTWDIYSHLYPETEQEAITRLEKNLFEVESHKNPMSEAKAVV